MLLFLSTLVTPPAAEVVSLDEVKAMLKFEASPNPEDALLDIFRLGAIAMAENFLNRKLLTQTWDLTLDGFPCSSDCQEIWLPYGATQSVTEIKYLDTDGVEQVWDAALYRLDTVYSQGRITPAFGEVFPQTQAVKGSVTIRFVCGYGDAPSDVPQEIRLAILFSTRVWYDNRASGDMPTTAQSLLWPHRLVEI
jgi:uncharacterized phiE125 gp8 family phage protein